MERLRGSAESTVDEKGRIKVPARFREPLETAYGSEFFITSVTGVEILVYPLPVWAAFEEKLAALMGGHIDASVFQPPVTLLARKNGFPILIDFSKEDFDYVVSGPITLRSFIRSDRETVMNFMRAGNDPLQCERFHPPAFIRSPG